MTTQKAERAKIVLVDCGDFRLSVTKKVKESNSISAVQRSLCEQKFQKEFQEIRFSDANRMVYGRQHWGETWTPLMTYAEIKRKWSVSTQRGRRARV